MSCPILHDVCHNPIGKKQNCIGCYNRFQQDCHDYYNGVGPLPKEMENMRRTKHFADRKI